MKKIINSLILFSLLAAFSACHQPEYYVPEGDGEVVEDNGLGIESLTAIFPTGTLHEGKELATLIVTDPEQTVFELRIPWFYPVTSDDETLMYMNNLRVKAKLRPNYKLRAKKEGVSLAKLDLLQSYDFILTAPDGSERDIVIKGKRVKLDLCELESLQIINPVMTISTIITSEEEDKHVLVPFKDDLSSVNCEVQCSKHATVYIGDELFDPKASYDMNDGQTVTVLAHDETTKAVYEIRQGTPELIEYGFSKSSVKFLFNVDPVSSGGVAPFTEVIYPSIAGLGQNIVLCSGDGTQPKLFNKYNGSPNGTLKLGSAEADVIANDEGDHLLIANYAGGGETVNVYLSENAAEDPVLLFSFANPLNTTAVSGGVGIGHRMKITGNIDTEATIVFTAEGVEGVTSASALAVVKVADRQIVGEPVAVDLESTGLAWGSAPDSFTSAVDINNKGYYISYYDDNNLYYVSPAGAKNVAYDGIATDDLSWALNANCMDFKTFNKTEYLVYFIVSHFPEWGNNPKLFLFEVNDPAAPALSLSYDSISPYQTGSHNGAGGASGDVCIFPAPDGFSVFIYYYDHQSHVLGAVMADCIKK
ncbi:MAG: DUF5018 domain-containing protein [Candidatus Cryptobacteroides sp.]